MATTKKSHTTESLVNRFLLSRLATTALSVSVVLTSVSTSPVLLMEVMGFDRGECATTTVTTAGVSMAVFFPTPFALSVPKPRVLMLTSQVLFPCAGVVLTLTTSHAAMFFGLTLICAGFSASFGAAMSQALGPLSLRAGVTSSALGIVQVYGSSLWIQLTVVLGLDVLNMLIRVLIGCGIVSIMLIIAAASNRSAPTYEEIPQQSRS